MAQRMTTWDTKDAMHEVVSEMYDKIIKGEPPTMTLPVRTKNNIGFDKNLESTSMEKEIHARCYKSWFC